MKNSPHADLLDIESALLDKVVQDWQGLPASFRPWGVWIRKCPEMMPGEDQINGLLLPQRVWFLNERGLHPRNVWEWQRFYTVHFEQPWCSKFFSKEPAIVFGAGKIGMAAFAPIAGTGRYYLETQWDGRWGHGWEVIPGADAAALTLKELWIS